MKVMCDTNDGFIISGKDLELRGSGDFFGTMQHGLPEFKIANLFEDMNILKQAQAIAQNIMEKENGLFLQENLKLKKVVNEKLNQLGSGTLWYHSYLCMFYNYDIIYVLNYKIFELFTNKKSYDKLLL